MKTIEYLIHFRGHGELRDCKVLEVRDGDNVENLARASADYWCRSHGSPFAHYSLIYRGNRDINGVVSRDIGAKYSVIVGCIPTAQYHDFRSKKDCDAFAALCCEKSVSHAVVAWTKSKRSKSRS